ncbi:MAG: hypothetical protein AB1806_15580 [Acidobacteriota bacterium]
MRRPCLVVVALRTTPTLVVLDREGIVRLYHPGRLAEDALDTLVRRLLGKTPA